MTYKKPVVKANNAHFLKGHASWLYCENCNKTVAYLCYVTYQYFSFSFVCSCGWSGSVENRYDNIDFQKLPVGELTRKPTNNRYCCANDESALFSPVPKNLKSYQAEVVCKQCNTRYLSSEVFE